MKTGDLVVFSSTGEIAGMFGIVLAVDPYQMGEQDTHLYVRVHFTSAQRSKTRVVQSSHLLVINESR
jgi:hypothetical protein